MGNQEQLNLTYVAFRDNSMLLGPFGFNLTFGTPIEGFDNSDFFVKVLDRKEQALRGVNDTKDYQVLRRPAKDVEHPITMSEHQFVMVSEVSSMDDYNSYVAIVNQTLNYAFSAQDKAKELLGKELPLVHHLPLGDGVTHILDVMRQDKRIVTPSLEAIAKLGQLNTFMGQPRLSYTIRRN